MKYLRSLVLFTVVFNLWVSTAHAQLTILPSAEGVSVAACNERLNNLELKSGKEEADAIKADPEYLGCAIKTGRISLNMVPFFVTYIINFLLALSGVVSVLFIVLGGYYYIYGGIADDKEKGKTIIVYALGGMAVALLSWVIVNTVLALLTS